jgi:uncharacterized protein
MTCKTVAEPTRTGMSTEKNKRLVSDFFARFSAGDLAGALAMMSDDATWWIAGTPGQVPGAGVHDKKKIARLLNGMFGELKSGIKMTVKAAIAEGDTVAVEVESYGELKNGRVYNNHYHFALQIHGGMISAVREYLDTQHAVATWSRP